MMQVWTWLALTETATTTGKVQPIRQVPRLRQPDDRRRKVVRTDLKRRVMVKDNNGWMLRDTLSSTGLVTL